MEKVMHQIAIVKFVDGYSTWDDSHSSELIGSVSEWEEVDDETFQTLKKSIAHGGRTFTIIERLSLDNPQIIKSVKDYVDFSNRLKEKELKAQELKQKKSYRT